MCKKRAAKLHDVSLFWQPESSHVGDCPICLLPLPLDIKKSNMMGCCCKLICNGCDYANTIRELKGRLEQKCPFCRHHVPKTQAEIDKNKMKRVEANNPVALCGMGAKHDQEGNYDTAFKYWAKAADLGDVMAHYNLSVMYREGEDIEKDEEMESYHLEQTVIAGHPDARYNLGCHEGERGRFDRAVKHFIIAANLGHDGSLKALKQCYVNGQLSKEDFAAALREAPSCRRCNEKSTEGGSRKSRGGRREGDE